MPFGKYKDFDDCVDQNKNVDDPAAYCATIMRAVEGDHTKKTLDNVEVFAKGTWTDSQGNTQTFSDAELDGMVRNFHDGAALKVGHSADDFNKGVAEALGVPLVMVTGEQGTSQGAVGLGKMSELKRVGERLVAKFRDVPEKLVRIIQDKLYTSVSAELSEQKDGSFAIEGVALLGAQHPAIPSLENRLSSAHAYSFSKMEQPTIADVTPVLGNTKKNKEETMPDPTIVDPLVSPDAVPGGDIQAALGLIAEAMGLDPKTATVEEIVAEVKGLKSKAGEDGAAIAATGPMMAKFEAVNARVSALEGENASLKREKKTLAFAARAKNWTSFIAEPDKEVASLVDMPDDKAEVIAKGYDHCFEVMSKSQFFERIGPAAAANTKTPVHEFAAKVLKFATDNQMSKVDAMLKCQEADKKGYESFMAFSRADNFQSYNLMFGKEPEKK